MKNLRLISLIVALAAIGAAADCNPDNQAPASVDGSTADGAVSPDAPCAGSYYFRDADGDGYGVTGPGDIKFDCSATPPTGYAALAGDCNDNDKTIHPGAAEVCDGVDNNCDGMIDTSNGVSVCQAGTSSCTYAADPNVPGHAFLICGGQLSQTVAATSCGMATASGTWQLVNVGDLVENTFLTTQVAQFGTIGAWIDAGLSGTAWQCPLKSATCGFQYWAGGNNSLDALGKNGPCADLASDGFWHGAACGTFHPFVCENGAGGGSD